VVETKQHGDAFDYYYSLGEKRTYVSVADRLHVASRTVERWAKAFNWRERIIQRDLEINRRTEEKTNKAIVNTKADYRAEISKDLESLAIIRERFEKLIGDATEAIQKGEIKIHDVNELDRVASGLKKLHDLQKDYINLDLKLIGEDVPDRSDLNIKLELPKDWNVDDIL
jgi:hypothetical protein